MPATKGAMPLRWSTSPRASIATRSSFGAICVIIVPARLRFHFVQRQLRIDTNGVQFWKRFFRIFVHALGVNDAQRGRPRLAAVVWPVAGLRSRRTVPFLADLDRLGREQHQADLPESRILGGPNARFADQLEQGPKQ